VTDQAFFLIIVTAVLIRYFVKEFICFFHQEFYCVYYFMRRAGLGRVVGRATGYRLDNQGVRV
jgi:hypothetical protein